MKKSTTTYLALGMGAAIIYLMWLNRSKIAPDVFNAPPETYLSYNYPDMTYNLKPVMPAKSSSCGCSPAASEMLAGVADKLNAQQQQAEKQIEEYIKSIKANLPQFYS